MSHNPLAINDVKEWLESRRHHLSEGVALADVRATTEHTPSAAADFEAAEALGRISIWVSGEIDFEVLRKSDGSFAFFKHEVASSVDDPRVEQTYREFLESLSTEGRSPQP